MEIDGLPSTVMPPPAVTLTFDLMTPKSNQHIYEPKCVCDQNLVKLPSLVFWDMVLHRFSGHCLLWPWPLTFWPQNVIITSTIRNISVTKIWWNSLHWFLRYGVHKVGLTDSRTHARTHARQSQTDRPESSMPPAPFFNGGGGIKMKAETTKESL